MLTTKQLKRIQEKHERVLRLGAPVIVYWSYFEGEKEHTYSALASITETGKDFIRASLDRDFFNDDHHLLYSAEYTLWIPKTNNPAWNAHNRFEKIK